MAHFEGGPCNSLFLPVSPIYLASFRLLRPMHLCMHDSFCESLH